MKQPSFAKSLKAEFGENKAYWLERINDHFEELLKEANRATKLHRHMAMHYCTRNKVSQVKIKHLKDMLRQTLRRKKDNDKIDSIAEASLIV